MNPAPTVPVLPAYVNSRGDTEPRDQIITFNRSVYIERFVLGASTTIFHWRNRRWTPMCF